MNFFIKKNSTLPILVFPITEKIMRQFNLTDEMFQNVAVTFSMVDSETGRFKIANKAGGLFINDDYAEYPELEKYSLTYKFCQENTSTSGLYLGEFVIDFLDNDILGKLKLPIDSEINIVINDTITKTSII